MKKFKERAKNFAGETTRGKYENIKFVHVEESQNGRMHIVTWNQPRSGRTIIDIYKDGKKIERKEVLSHNKLHIPVQSGSTYEYYARSGESAPKCSSGPFDTGPLDPREVKVETSNGGVKFSCPKEEKSHVYAKIKDGKKTVCKKFMKGAQKMEFFDLKSAGVKSGVFHVLLYTVNHAGKKSKAIEHKMHLDDSLDVTLYVYHSHSRVFVCLFLEGKNPEYERDIAKKRKNYRATDPEVYHLWMSPGDKFRGRLQCLDGAYAITIHPPRGHSVSYDDVSRRGCMERTFVLFSDNMQPSHSSLPLVFSIGELTIPIDISLTDKECPGTSALSKSLDVTVDDPHDSSIPEGLKRSSNKRNSRVKDWNMECPGTSALSKSLDVTVDDPHDSSIPEGLNRSSNKRNSRVKDWNMGQNAKPEHPGLDNNQNCDNFSDTSDYGTLSTIDRVGSKQTLNSEYCITLDIFGNTTYIIAVYYLDDKATAKDVYNRYTGHGFMQIGFSQKFELRREDNMVANLFGPIDPSYHNLWPEDLFTRPVTKQHIIKRDSRETTVRYELKQIGNLLLNFSFLIGESTRGGITRNGPQYSIHVGNRETNIAGKMANHGGQFSSEEHGTSNPMNVKP